MQPRYNLRLLAIFSGILLLLGACSSEQWDTPSQPSSGMVTLNIPYLAAQAPIQSRATQPLEVESRIDNLTLFIFNSQGDKIDSYFFDANQLGASSPTQGKINVEVPSGQALRVFALANIDSELFTISQAQLQQVATWTDLQQIEVRLRQATTARGSSFVMTGTLEDAQGREQLIQPQHLQPIEQGTHSLRLRRIDAKVRFRIQTPTGVEFKAESWQIVNLAQATEAVTPTGYSRNAEFFNSPLTAFEEQGDEFSFYLLENKQTPRQTIDSTLPNTYQAREKRIKHPMGATDPYKPGQTVVSGAFEYAPEQGTYVVFTGLLSYTDLAGRAVIADVTYRVHLGYADRDPNDYSVNRNTDYLYNITIQSAESILIEVNYGTEKQPGATGHITQASEIIQVDSHYETRTLTFHHKDIHNLSWYVNTPFSEGYREDLYTQPHEGDSDWVLFLVNRQEYNSYEGGYTYASDYRQFPGEHHRLPFNATVEDIFHNSRSANPRLMSATQLIHLIIYIIHYYPDLLFDNNQEFKVTAFVQEFHYENHPLTGVKDKTLWKQFVNTPERTLTFLNLSQFSADGESSVNQALVSIRQNSIQTHYNKNNGALQTAWGTESIQETGALPFEQRKGSNSIFRKYDSPSNGRSNTLEILKDASNQGQYWNTFINPYTQTMTSDYQAAKYACMQRNRDNNGDGRISPDEIRWYLASINQLSDLWIGDRSLSMGAKLDQPDTRTNQWYASSTIYRNRFLTGYNDPMVLWSAEGSSLGYLYEIEDTHFNDKVHYRCVRNLGIPLNDANEEPQDVVQVQGGLVDLSRLDKRSIRAYTQQKELPRHHERSANNLPWTQFEVLDGINTGTRKNWADTQTLINQGYSPCPKGYRAPNQRELAIMQSRITTGWSKHAHFSRTYFSSYLSDGVWRGFMVNRTGERMHLTNNTNLSYQQGGIRCVRDR